MFLLPEKIDDFMNIVPLDYKLKDNDIIKINMILGFIFGQKLKYLFLEPIGYFHKNILVYQKNIEF